jgi:hypothetical protein
MKQLLQKAERYQLGKLKQQLMQAVASSSNSSSRSGGGATSRSWRDPQQVLYDELMNLGDYDLVRKGRDCWCPSAVLISNQGGRA